MPKHWTRQPWTRAAVISAALCLAAVAAFLDAWADLFSIVKADEEASQAWLAAPVAAWILWSRRKGFARFRPRVTWVGPCMIAVGSAATAAGYQYAIQTLWHGGAVLALAGALVTPLGLRFIQLAWPSLVALVFLIPPPGRLRLSIAIPLQERTAAATHTLLSGLGVDIERTGSVLVYAGEQIAVAEACNGMRMVFALVAVGYAFAFAHPWRPWLRIAVLLSTPFLAIAANVARLIPTVLAYGMYPESVAKPFHDLAGWAMLAAVFVALTGVVAALEWAGLPVRSIPAGAVADARATPPARMKGARHA
ncbi:MAG: exosortase/archaeosortase family protein [Planctomycetota bacterium]